MKIKYLIFVMAFLSMFSAPALAEKVLMVDLTINNNDSVSLNNIMVVEGKMKQWDEGNYKIRLLDSSGSVIESQLLPVDFFISGIGEIDTIPAEIRFSNYTDAAKLQVLKDDKIIFESPISLQTNLFAGQNIIYIIAGIGIVIAAVLLIILLKRRKRNNDYQSAPLT